MNIVSWNVNGLRRLLDSTGQSLEALLDSLNGDIICLQETKLLRGRLDPDLVLLQKYWAFHNTSSARLGASGVSTFCRKATATPVAASLGFILKGYEAADQDGRVIVTDHSEFLVINAYFPTGAGSAQLLYKVWFMNVIQLTMEYFCAEEERGIVLVGDLGFIPCSVLSWTYAATCIGSTILRPQAVSHTGETVKNVRKMKAQGSTM